MYTEIASAHDANTGVIVSRAANGRRRTQVVECVGGCWRATRTYRRRLTAQEAQGLIDSYARTAAGPSQARVIEAAQ